MSSKPSNTVAKASFLASIVGLVGVLLFIPGGRGTNDEVFIQFALGIQSVGGASVGAIALPALVVCAALLFGGFLFGIAKWEADTSGSGRGRD